MTDIMKAIKAARVVCILAHSGYSDSIGYPRVVISKKEACRLIIKAPENAKPSAYWQSNDVLVLMPECDRDD